MINCIIIDDEQHAIELLLGYALDIPYLNVSATTNNPIEGITLINQNDYDLIFLDIQMPKIMGLDLLESIPDRSKVVITSAHKNYAADGYEFEVMDFLTKPVKFDRFLKVTQKALNNLKVKEAGELKPSDFIFVKLESKNKLKKIKYADILYVEGSGNYITLYTSKEKILTYLTLRDFEETMPTQLFLRIHKSHIVAIDKIQGTDGNQLIMQGDNTLSISEAYKEKVFQIIEKQTIYRKK